MHRRPSRRSRPLYTLHALEPRQLLATFAVIGDFTDGTPLHDVADRIKSWNSEYIVTVGDNWYSDPTIDDSVGQSFHDFISPYQGSYGAGSTSGNRFWPTIGNHDYDNGISEYFSYFTLPNNERYYTVQKGNVGLFIVNSNQQESNGTTSSSTQGQWLKNALAASTATWKLVFFHQPAYTSGTEGDHTYMQWPFQSWGATAVIAGHDHLYERLLKNNFPYFVNGLGGAEIVPNQRVESGSQIRYSSNYGAMRIDAGTSSINFQFITRTGSVIDNYTLGTPTPTIPSAPTNLSAGPRSTTEVQLNWTDASPSSTTTFKIERSSDGSNFTQIATTNVGTTSYTDPGRTSGSTYTYRVRANNTAGNSGYSNTAAVTLPSGDLTYVSDLTWVGTPTNGYGPVEKDTSNGSNAAGDGNTITLNGATYPKGLGAHATSDIIYNLGAAYSFFHSDIGIDDETGAASGLVFQVYADGVKVFDSGPMTQSSTTQSINLNITGVQQLRLHLDDLDGDFSYDHGDWAGAYVLAPGTPPAAPTNLVASAVGGSQVNLSWSENATNETSYLIERSTNNISFTQIATAPTNASTYNDTTVAGSTQYYYRIRATNGANSAYSNTATVTTPTVPQAPIAPSGLLASASSSSQITLTWTDNSTNETGFKIERSPNGASAWTLMGTVATNVSTYTDTNNVLPSTTYFYRVRATNFAGDSLNSNTASATTPSASPAGSQTYIPTGSTWKFLDNGTNQGTAWRAATFTDSAWKSGPAQLGYGDADEATVVSYGSNANTKFVTTYFRKTFAVTDPTQVTALALRLLRDDGAVVYLNGAEIYRSNMPTGAIAYTTLASSSVEDNTYFSASVDPALLVAGNNTIAVEIHQSDRTSSDLSFDLELKATLSSDTSTAPAAPSGLLASASSSSQINLTWTDNATNETGFKIERSLDGATWTQIATVAANITAYSNTGLTASTRYDYRVRATNAVNDSAYSNTATATTPATSTTQNLILSGNTWTYLDNGTNQATAWRATTFNDSAWKSGASQLGYGDGDEATVVSFGPSTTNRYVTTYFRKTFSITDPSQITALTLRLIRDDGAVVYLNGAEVFRDNIGTAAVAYNTLATTALGAPAESTWLTTTLNKSLLVAGNNTLAVEIHQSDLNSSDISFDLELIATGTFTSAATTSVITSPQTTTALKTTSTAQFLFSDQPIDPLLA